jgi:hypothetical protein
MPKPAAQLEREIARALTARPHLHHASKRAPSTTIRWTHGAIAKRYEVPEDVVRKIYAAVQISKRQGLYGGHMADFIERNVGRRLVGAEYTVAAKAREHLAYDPPSGYGGPTPKWSAKEPTRHAEDAKKIEHDATRLVAIANQTIKDVVHRAKQRTEEARYYVDVPPSDRDRLRQAADELEVAADNYEEAGPPFQLRAGTLRQRAKLARSGDYRILDAYT